MLITVLIITSILILIINKGSSCVSREQTYLLADRNVSCFTLTATLVMTELNPSTLIAFSSLGYHAGWWALSLPFVFLCGLLFYAISVAKKWKSFNGISVTDFFHYKYGSEIGRLAAVCLWCAMAGFSATYVKAMTLMFGFLCSTLTPWIVSGIIMLLCLLTTIRGGLLAIVRMDVVSFVGIIILFIILLFLTWKNTGAISYSNWIEYFPKQEIQKILPHQFVASIIILTMFTYILAPWYGQKIFSAKRPSR